MFLKTHIDLNNFHYSAIKRLFLLSKTLTKYFICHSFFDDLLIKCDRFVINLFKQNIL